MVWGHWELTRKTQSTDWKYFVKGEGCCLTKNKLGSCENCCCEAVQKLWWDLDCVVLIHRAGWGWCPQTGAPVLALPTCTYLDFCSGFSIQAFIEQPKQLAVACAFRQLSGQRLLFCQNEELWWITHIPLVYRNLYVFVWGFVCFSESRFLCIALAALELIL